MVGGDDVHALTLQFRRDGPQQGVVATGLGGKQKPGRAPVRSQVQRPGLVDGSGHDHVGHAAGGEEVDESAELAELEPGEGVAVRGEGRVRVRGEPDANDPFAPFAGRTGHVGGEGTSACDDAKGPHGRIRCVRV